MIEKRQSPRFSCEGPDTCLVEFPDMEEVGRLENISRSGLAFRLPRQLRENASYNFHIRAGGRDAAIPCRAKVVWVRTDEATQSCRCGAVIEDMDKAVKAELIDGFYEQWKKKELARIHEARAHS